MSTEMPITADLVLVDDNIGPDVNDACETIVNGAAISGKIAVIRRGDCTFVSKNQAAQDEGVIAVIILNNVATDPVNMGGASATITIPSIMITQADGVTLTTEILARYTINATIQNNNISFDRDGDFDNAIIAHEYGHGLSNRLVGGPGNTGCLFDSQQMGEGWSDYFGLMLTIEPGDQGSDGRGVGTFATGQPITGTGFRPAPYSTDFGINDYTYADIANLAIPHRVGFVWCSTIWDMTWDLIAQDGFDPDLYNGTGGNNISMQLVIEGLKLIPCGTNFLQGRDAILAADQLLYGGANQCLIWEAFARRGMGSSAVSGSGVSVTEAFDLPPICQIPTEAPVADFSSEVLSICGGEVVFSGLSTSIPQSWQWDFGDSSPLEIGQNPVHTYAEPGNYEVTLSVNGGLCSITQNIMVMTTGIEDVQTAPAFTIAPNPCDDHAVISFHENVNRLVTIQLVSIDGRMLKEVVILSGENQLTMDLKDLPAAIYLVRLCSEEFSMTRKLAVQR